MLFFHHHVSECLPSLFLRNFLHLPWKPLPTQERLSLPLVPSFLALCSAPSLSLSLWTSRAGLDQVVRMDLHPPKLGGERGSGPWGGWGSFWVALFFNS